MTVTSPLPPLPPVNPLNLPPIQFIPTPNGLGTGLATKGGQLPTTGTTSGPHTATATSAHDMLKAIGIELAFVVVATMVAGVSDSWATAMVTLMLALLVLRGLFEIDVFAAFAQGTTLRPS